MTKPPTWWEQEGRDDTLRRLISEGSSYAEAAVHFRDLGFAQISRSSCYRRAKRIGLMSPMNVIELRTARKSVSARLQHRNNPTRPPLREHVPVEVLPAKLPARDAKGRLYDLETLPASGCRWPHGDLATANLHFCAHPMQGLGPYCADHMALAQVSSSKPRRASFTPVEMARAFGGV